VSGASKPSGGVLDRNLERLLRRAYVPALPRPELRRDLHAAFVAEFERLHGTEPATTAGHGRGRLLAGPWRAFATAALVLLAVGVGLFGGFGGFGGEPTLDELLARGDVAVRDGASEPWRAADGAVAWGDAGFELATGEGASGALRGLSGTVAVGPGSRLAARSLELELTHGSLALDHTGAGPPWRVVTPHGTLGLAAGDLAVKVEDERVALVTSAGDAWLDADAGRVSLVRGVPSTLVAGALAGAEVAADEPEPASAGSGREPLDVAGVPGPTDTAEPTTNTVGATLAGTVVDDATGEPVTSFTVARLRVAEFNQVFFPEQQAVEDAGGAFRLTGLDAHETAVYVQAEGYALSLVATVELVEGDVVEVAARLVRGGTVRGYVIDEATGNPVPGAYVLSENDTPMTSIPLTPEELDIWTPTGRRTASDGAFELEHLAPGVHSLRVTHAGYGPGRVADVEVTENGTVGPIAVRLGAPSGVRGQVLGADGVPRAGAQVICMTIGPSRARQTFAMDWSDALGQFSMGDLGAGMHILVLISEAQPAVKFVQLTPGEWVEQDIGSSALGRRFVGRLTDASGEPLRALNLSLNRVDERGRSSSEDFIGASTDADGRFAFDGVELGRVQLCLAQGLGTTIVLLDEFDVPDWPEVERDYTLQVGGIAGHIRDSAGETVRNAVIYAEQLDEETGTPSYFAKTVTDEDGGYLLPHLPAGRYAVVTRSESQRLAMGYQEVSVVTDDPEVPATSTADFELGPGAEATIVVVDLADRPVAGARLHFSGVTGAVTYFDEPERSVTDEHGRHSAHGLLAGDWEIVVTAADGTVARAGFSVLAGQHVERTVRLPMNATPRSAEGQDDE
jgi:hypothetical protein